MRELVRRLLQRPGIAAELLLASLFANVLALASSLFVIQVLNRYVTYGVGSTLATLTAGVVAAILLEIAFRQARLRLADGVIGGSDEARATGAFGVLVTARRVALDSIDPGARREVLRGLDTIEQAYGGPNVAAVLDVPFTPVFIAALALLNPLLGVIAAGFIGAVFVFSLINQRSLAAPSRRLGETAAAGNVLATACVDGADTVRAFNGAAFLIPRWHRYVREIQALRHRIAARQGVMQQVTHSAQALMGVVIIAVGAILVVNGELDTGTMIGANILAARGLGPITRFAQLNDLMAKGAQALARVRELARLPIEPSIGSALEPYRGALEFRDVAFSFPDAKSPLYESLSLVVAPGTVLAVTGRNGSGKTTLARLIAGLIEPTRGQILADGVDIRQLVPAWWRRQIMYLPQEPTFLDGSIKDNLLTANPALDDATLNRIVREAGLGPFIDQSPRGLDTPITAGGHRLAVGIRRRLALARAVAVGGRLVVFDEPTEGLDDFGRAAVYAILKNLSAEGRTIVAFSHDPNLLRGATVILDINQKPTPNVLTTPILEEIKKRAKRHES